MALADPERLKNVLQVLPGHARASQAESVLNVKSVSAFENHSLSRSTPEGLRVHRRGQSRTLRKP